MIYHGVVWIRELYIAFSNPRLDTRTVPRPSARPSYHDILPCIGNTHVFRPTSYVFLTFLFRLC